MGTKTPSTQTVTNKTEVDPTTDAWRQAIFQTGTNLFNQGAPNYYPGTTVAPFSQQTQAGIGMMQDQAAQGAIGLPQAYQSQFRAMSGYTPGMNTAMQASNGGMMNPFYGQIGQAASMGATPQVAGMLNAGMGANPYTSGIAQAGQASVANQLNPYFQQAINSSGNANPYAQQIAQAGATPTSMGVDTLQSFTGQQNPYLQQMYEQGREQITNDLNARFAGAGRTGANAAYGNALGNSLGQLYTGIMAPGYENAQNRMMQAGSQLAGIDQGNRSAAMQGYQAAGSLAGQQTNNLLNTLGMYSDVLGSDVNRNLSAQQAAGGLMENAYGRGLQGAGMYGDLLNTDYNRLYQGSTDLAGLYGQDMATRLQGANMAGNMWSQGNADASQATNNLAGLYQYGGMPAQQMLGAGSAIDAYNQQLIDADMARYNYGQNANWDNLSRFAAMMNGLPDFSSQTQTTTGNQSQNRLMGALGGGMGMYGALMMNPATAPFALAGGLLGGLGGAFG